ncbi:MULTISPECIES: type II toxin-antitoxin system PemK/MazF family toxin [Helcococcus]|uniref:Type II toxin-antitoxin system PemK/MazF family toxin n=1 Tax=Helcococcus bovis TaxID=3153252 RepID=A0ABW9F8F6_9FIRM
MSKEKKIYTVIFRYFDLNSRSIKSKKRPFLILKEEYGKSPKDLTCLPISSINDKTRINDKYDVLIEKKNTFPKLNLNSDKCYVRTHKIQTINEKELIFNLCDNIEELYPELYTEITNKVKDFIKDI